MKTIDIFLGRETILSKFLTTNKRKQIFISLRQEIKKQDLKFLNSREKKNIFIVGGYPTKELNNLTFGEYHKFLN